MIEKFCYGHSILLYKQDLSFDREFEKLVLSITEKGLNIVLLIDEYEDLLSNIFHKVDRPFGLIRDLATKDLNEKIKSLHCRFKILG